ncbi:MAG: DsbA family protein [Chloroflexota bacterium]|nr:DsbA family protein [Chloroflexota bacterium]MBI5702283.1 DsbA family protein [Chloroflexota bacterium]
MSLEKKSKRQERREKMRKNAMKNRLIIIGLITAGALLVVLAFIWPQFTTVDNLIVPEAKTLPNPNGLSLGDPNAPAVIEVFEDFQCPACQYFTENVEPLIIQYLVETGKARLVYRHYPFIDGPGADNGGESDQAANAAMCANEQGKFWELKAVIFANWNGENRGNLSDRRLVSMAEAIKLDMDAFNACFESNKYKADIQADFDRGEELGVSGTPSAFVNGVQVGQPGKIPTFQDIAVAVDAIAGAGE